MYVYMYIFFFCRLNIAEDKIEKIQQIISEKEPETSAKPILENIVVEDEKHDRPIEKRTVMAAKHLNKK